MGGSAEKRREVKMGIRRLEKLEDFEMVLKESGSKLVIIDFSATWCGPCKIISSLYLNLAESNPNVVFCEVDVDDASEIAEYCKVNCMPTFQFYKNGEKLFSFSGANGKTLEAKVKELQ
ncbi:thioredoxin-like isoform X2 [Narcine bancroftii]|uniref:thioredoxin-like isoform X2 n=1 Tax=Narcine bancroftii TaxID=1343680 RepID=UPI003831BA92